MSQAKTVTKVPSKKASVAEKKPILKKATTVVKKPAAVKPVSVTTAKKTTTTKSSAGSTKKVEVSPEQRYIMIAEAAYYRAEKRGFVGGNSAQDWVDAEAEINQLLSTP